MCVTPALNLQFCSDGPCVREAVKGRSFEGPKFGALHGHLARAYPSLQATRLAAYDSEIES